MVNAGVRHCMRAKLLPCIMGALYQLISDCVFVPGLICAAGSTVRFARLLTCHGALKDGFSRVTALDSSLQDWLLPVTACVFWWEHPLRAFSDSAQRCEHGMKLVNMHLLASRQIVRRVTVDLPGL